MKIRIKRFDKTIPLPEYKTAGAAGFDLSAGEMVTIPARQVGYVPLNIALQLPQDCWLLLSARSSLHKSGVILANGIGVGDPDFSGDGDEYQAALFNFTDKEVTIEKGQRIVQAIIVSRHQAELEEVNHLGNPDRGGFGSTGK